MTKKIFFCFVVISFGLFFGKSVQAFSVSPSKILLTLEPGDHKTISIKVKNNENKDLIFAGSVVGVRQDNQGKPVFLTGYTEAERWIKLEQQEVLILSDQEDILNFIINVPKNTPAGSYYLGLVVKPSLDNKGMGLTGQIVSLLNLQVGGIIKEELVINKWDIDKEKISKESFVFDLTLENKSNIEIDLKGKIVVYDWRNKLISENDIYLGNKLLAYSSRFLKPQIKISKRSWFSPYYSVKIDINFGKTNQTVITQAKFFIYSDLIKLILPAFALLVVSILILKIKNKKKHK